MTSISIRKLHQKSLSGDFWIDILLLYSIVVDSINGALQYFYNVHTPIGMIFRFTLMVILLRNFHRIPRRGCPIGVLWLPMLFLFGVSLGMAYWTLSIPYSNIPFEMTELTKFLYSTVVILYIYTQIDKIEIPKLLLLAYTTFAFLGFLNLVCALNGWGNTTYRSLNVGTKAFYADGNSFGLLMNMLCPCAILHFFSTTTHRLYLALGLLTGIIGTYLIASRAAIIGISSTIVITSLLLLFIKFRDIRISKVARVLLSFTPILLLTIALNGADSFLNIVNRDISTRFTQKALSSARGDLIATGEKVIAEYSSIGEFIWGRGKYGGGVTLAKELHFNLELKGVEAELHDSILFYGWVFGGVLILIHTLLWWYNISGLLIQPDFRNFMLSLSATLWFALSILAGHGFGNVLLAPVLGLLLAIRFSNSKYISERYLKSRLND